MPVASDKRRVRIPGGPSLRLGVAWMPTILMASACVGSELIEPPVFDGGSVDLGVDAGPADLGTPMDMGTPDMGDPNLTEVSSALPTLTVTSSCVAIREGERAVSVDPEGHLWLVSTSTAQPVTVRVLDGWGEASAREWRTRLRSVDYLRAESATIAAVVSEGQLWSLEEGTRIQIGAPFTPDGTTTTCGEVGESAFVMSAGELFQREGNDWTAWSGLGMALTGDSQLLPRDGACRGMGDTLYLQTGRLTVWALTSTAITQVADLMGATGAAFRDNELYVVSSDGELYRDTVRGVRWRFEDGAVSDLTGAGSYAWLRVGDELLRYDGQAFERVTAVRGRVRLMPFAAGGIWLATDQNVCSVTPSEMLRVRGLGPSRVVRGSEVKVGVRARSAGPVTVQLGTTPLSPVEDRDGWTVYAAALPNGWSTLALSSGDAERQVELRRAGILMPPPTSWQTDIQPIYAAHCSAAACHVADSPSGAPNLDSFTSWVANAGAIERRVINGDDMPPPASRGPTYGPDTVQTMQNWIVGGLRP